MSATNAIYTIIGVLGLAGGLFAFWAGLKMRRTANQVRQNGVAGEAIITEKKVDRVVRRHGASTTFYLTYQFDGNGPTGQTSTYTQRQQVKAGTFNSLNEEDKVPILYLPANPAGTARLAGGYADDSDSTSAFTFGGGCLIGGLILLLLPAIMAGSAASQAATRSTATAARVASESPDWAVIRAGLEPHFAAWKEITDRTMHRVSPADVGLEQVKLDSIVYGYCSDGVFYALALKPFREGRTPDIHVSDSYSYFAKHDPFCHPSGWLLAKWGDLGDGWSFSSVIVIDSTPTAAPQ